MKITRRGVGKMKEKVEAALEKIRPALQADGCNVSPVDINEVCKKPGSCARAFYK